MKEASNDPGFRLAQHTIWKACLVPRKLLGGGGAAWYPQGPCWRTLVVGHTPAAKVQSVFGVSRKPVRLLSNKKEITVYWRWSRYVPQEFGAVLYSIHLLYTYFKMSHKPNQHSFPIKDLGRCSFRKAHSVSYELTWSIISWAGERRNSWNVLLIVMKGLFLLLFLLSLRTLVLKHQSGWREQAIVIVVFWLLSWGPKHGSFTLPLSLFWTWPTCNNCACLIWHQINSWMVGNHFSPVFQSSMLPLLYISTSKGDCCSSWVWLFC